MSFVGCKMGVHPRSTSDTSIGSEGDQPSREHTGYTSTTSHGDNDGNYAWTSTDSVKSTDVSPRFTKKAALATSLFWGETSSIEGASKQAHLLRKRRLQRASTADCVSDDEDGASGSLGNVTPPKADKHPSGQLEVANVLAIKNAMEGLRQLMLDNSHELEKMSDRVISQVDARFARHMADLQQKILGVWQLKRDNTHHEHDKQSPASPGEGKQITQGLRSSGLAEIKRQSQASHQLKGFQVQHTPAARPPTLDLSLTVSEQNSKEAIELDCARPHMQPIPTSLSSEPEATLKTVSTSETFTTSESSFANVLRAAERRNRSKIAQMIWLYLEDPRLMPSGQAYVRLLLLIICSSCCLNIVQTVESPPLGTFTESVLDYAVDSLLSVEILVRFAVCPNRLSFWSHGLNLLDLVTGPLTLIARVTLTLYSDETGADSTASMLLTCWLPLGQLLRLIRRFEGSYLIYVAFKTTLEALPVLLYGMFLIITTFASILYALEPRDNIGSLPEALWFVVVSLGTVGYGDVTPQTAEGKVVTCVLVIVSALYMAMPLGIVGKVFSEVWDDRNGLLLTQLARQRFKNLGYTAKDIPAMFLSADLNKDGILDMKEFTTMMKALQFDLSGERAAELFKVFDVDGGGSIDDQEFLSILYPEAAAKIYGDDDNAVAKIYGDDDDAEVNEKMAI